MGGEFGRRRNIRVELKNVRVAYSGSRKPAIENVTLSLDSGFVVITGPNGAGKTTLLETMLGLLKPYKGEAYLFGVNTKSRKVFEVRKLCSYVPQDFMKPPFESYTALDVIKLGFASLKWDKNAEERVKKVASDLGIRNLLNTPFGKLSGGQQQKVILCRALARNPEALFLDEPFSSLDKESRRVLCSLLKEYAVGRLVVAVCHDVEAVKSFADRIIRMEGGRVI